MGTQNGNLTHLIHPFFSHKKPKSILKKFATFAVRTIFVFTFSAFCLKNNQFCPRAGFFQTKST
jgi:hypothetical protein